MPFRASMTLGAMPVNVNCVTAVIVEGKAGSPVAAAVDLKPDLQAGRWARFFLAELGNPRGGQVQGSSSRDQVSDRYSTSPENGSAHEFAAFRI
jgi:hypothetical protein